MSEHRRPPARAVGPTSTSDSERFRRLLAKYDDDYQRATDAYLRGEDAPTDRSGSDNPM